MITQSHDLVFSNKVCYRFCFSANFCGILSDNHFYGASTVSHWCFRVMCVCQNCELVFAAAIYCVSGQPSFVEKFDDLKKIIILSTSHLSLVNTHHSKHLKVEWKQLVKHIKIKRNFISSNLILKKSFQQTQKVMPPPAVEEKFKRNFWVNGEMRDEILMKICNH